MQTLIVTTLEDDFTRQYSFECHSPTTAADIVSTTVRNLDSSGGQLLGIETR